MPKPGKEQVKEAALACWMKVPAEGMLFLAVSGGVDSVVLLEAMHRFSPSAEALRRLVVVHINHGLRGSESKGDEAFVREAALSRGLQFQPFRLSWATGNSPSQDDCRKEREKIFHSLCRQNGDRVLLAHHLNDQAETLLFRLIRGTGLRGLRGMAPASGWKLRPFLSLEKSTLREAAHFWKLVWREDSSNESIAYERNWIRTILLPLIEERRPGFPAKLAALAEEAWLLHAEASTTHLAEGKTFQPIACGENIYFARPPANCGLRELHEAYQLGRLHAKSLQSLLSRPSGQLHAEKVRFSWSAGILLAERGECFSAEVRQSMARPRQVKLESCLGTWLLPDSLAHALEPPPLSSGERAKKEFQKLRIPLFFRPAVPLLWEAGRPKALLPGRLEALKAGGKINFSPTPLALWWLESRD